jgi:hypothetical protein
MRELFVVADLRYAHFGSSNQLNREGHRITYLVVIFHKTEYVRTVCVKMPATYLVH